MKRLQAFKFELEPNGKQDRDARRFDGSCRLVFNKALSLQKENYEAGNKFINYVAMAKLLTTWRNSKETPWLKEAPCHPLQQSLKDLEKAFKNFFSKKSNFPRFKKKCEGGSFRYPDPAQIKLDQDNSRIFYLSLDGYVIVIVGKYLEKCVMLRFLITIKNGLYRFKQSAKLKKIHLNLQLQLVSMLASLILQR